MSANIIKQELLNEVYHDHYHFERMFEALKEMFRLVVTQELSLVESPDVWRTANEDLEFLIDELIAHFESEEEAVFPVIVEKHPEFANEIDDLQAAHDSICMKLCALKGKLNQDASDVQPFGMAIYDSLSELARIIEGHAVEENGLFEAALEELNHDECKQLRDALREF